MLETVMADSANRGFESHPARQSAPAIFEPTFHGSAGRILSFLAHLSNEGYRPSSIESHGRILRYLARNGSIEDPESIRSFIASRHVSGGRKENLVEAYRKYALYHQIIFRVPHYSRVDSLPFIPLQAEIEQLVTATRNLRQATVLQLIYETGVRIGEASSLKREHFDFQRQTVRVVPEKGSNARELPLSGKLCGLLARTLAKFPENPFPSPGAARHYLETTRRVLAETTGNERYLRISLKTLRHFKATFLYAQTKDLLYVKKILGHKRIENTLRYTQLVKFEDPDCFTCKIARTPEEAQDLIESGFEFVTDFDGAKMFRKRKL